jgi:hypothetical protein
VYVLWNNESTHKTTIRLQRTVENRNMNVERQLEHALLEMRQHMEDYNTLWEENGQDIQNNNIYLDIIHEFRETAEIFSSR